MNKGKFLCCVIPMALLCACSNKEQPTTATTAGQTTEAAPATTAEQITEAAPTTTAEQTTEAAPTTTAEQTTEAAPTTTAEQTTEAATEGTADSEASMLDLFQITLPEGSEWEMASEEDKAGGPDLCYITTPGYEWVNAYEGVTEPSKELQKAGFLLEQPSSTTMINGFDTPYIPWNHTSMIESEKLEEGKWLAVQEFELYTNTEVGLNNIKEEDNLKTYWEIIYMSGEPEKAYFLFLDQNLYSEEEARAVADSWTEK